MSTEKKGMFVLPDGKNVLFTFILVSSLFLLWGVCNGMIDVMDKHFQDELNLTKSQSAWVQFAHYLGYFLMAMPAGWLATRLGYKGGIIAGLLLVAVGGFWFVPATKINALAHAGAVSATTAFIGYLAGVCAIAAGLTFLETIANPYTTVLGPPRYAATRINAAQSCNGVGWIFGPIIGSMFFYSKDAVTGRSTGSETLYIPYLIVAVVVVVLAIVFKFAYMPDVRMEDDYHLDDQGADTPATERKLNQPLIYVLLLFNGAILAGVVGMILALILSAFDITTSAASVIVTSVSAAFLAVLAAMFVPMVRKMTHHSIWSHPHFSGAVLAQFFYVAAQAGIFAFVINYMTAETPSVSSGWRKSLGERWVEVRTVLVTKDIKDWPSFAARVQQKKDPVSAFLNSELSPGARAALADYKTGDPVPKPLQLAMVQDVNVVIRQDPTKVKPERLLYSPERFSGVTLGAGTSRMLANRVEQAQRQQEMTKALEQVKAVAAKRFDDVQFADKERQTSLLEKFERKTTRILDKMPRKEVNLAQLNRNLLLDAYPQEIPFNESILCFSDMAASIFASIGFGCFLLGRVIGALLLKKLSAHKIVGLYAALNVLCCGLVFMKLGWFSVVCVFLCYFFMSIMFPTIFALGIFGLGARAKKASAYIVMAIMGGAMLPKLMGRVIDWEESASRGFIVPLVCFILIAAYGFIWPRFSQAESLHGVGASGGH